MKGVSRGISVVRHSKTKAANPIDGLMTPRVVLRAKPEVCYGSQCKELNLSRSSPPCLTKRTSTKCAATSLKGQNRKSDAYQAYRTKPLPA
jgi:hypothetical protein